MKFTVDNVLSLLLPYRGRPYVRADGRRKYKWISLLPGSAGELDPAMIYVCRLSEAMLLNRLEPECLYVCISDRYLSEDERDDEELLKNIIIIEESGDVPWLFNLIQKRFLELFEWEKSMEDVLLNGGGYQELLDVSENYLKNPLFVLDGAYFLLAYSKHYKSPDPANTSLYENGYHSAEIMQRFYDTNRIVEYNNSRGIVIGVPGAVSRYESLVKHFKYNEIVQLSVVEVFSNIPKSLESVELFELLLHYINISFLNEQKISPNTNQPYSRFMSDMIYGTLTERSSILEYAKRTEIPMAGYFDAYRIVFEDNAKVLTGRFAQELSGYLPASKIIIRGDEISVMNIYSRQSVSELSAENIQRITPLLARHRAVCGVSTPFFMFTDLRHACAQAAQALSYAGKDSRYLPLKERDNRTYYYQDILICHMLDLSSVSTFDVFCNNPYIRKLRELIEYDHENDSSLADILYCYLLRERRATEAGKLLHMHRNTVLYHIQRASELINMDLDDYNTRQCLLMAFHFIGLRDTGYKDVT